MDFNKSASAPGWDDEKSSMVQNPPPPYQDSPGGAQPGPAYPQQGYGYPQQPGAVYNQQPGAVYNQQPGAVYNQQPGAVYNQQPYPMGQQHPGQPVPVAIQPTVYVTQSPLQHPVNDYLGYSIFTMLCCCLPLGIAALIYSISAREANHVGDRMSAERNSRTARTLNHVALGLGIGSLVLFIIYIAVVATSFGRD